MCYRGLSVNQPRTLKKNDTKVVLKMCPTFSTPLVSTLKISDGAGIREISTIPPLTKCQVVLFLQKNMFL